MLCVLLHPLLFCSYLLNHTASELVSAEQVAQQAEKKVENPVLFVKKRFTDEKKCKFVNYHQIWEKVLKMSMLKGKGRTV